MPPTTPQTDALTDAQLRAAEVEVIEGFLRDLRDQRRIPLTPYAQTLSSSGPTTLLTPAAGMRIEIWKFGWTPRRQSTDEGNLVTLRWADVGGGVDNIWTAAATQQTYVWLGDTNRPLEVNLAAAEQIAMNVWYREVA